MTQAMRVAESNMVVTSYPMEWKPMKERSCRSVPLEDRRLNTPPDSQQSASIGLLSVEGGMQPTAVEPLSVLGHGRAAEARLVRVTDQRGETSLCVEKVFHPGWLTRFIYFACFQSRFAYQYNVDAISACFYRRRVAAGIVETIVPEAKVARPLYVRWDEETEALVLASEYIRGRGIVPQEVDASMLRRRFASYFAANKQSTPAPPAEIDTLLELMNRLEKVLVQCGLTGSGWQVCTRAMVSTANLLRTEQGYVVVDLESGIPSVLVPAYLMQAVRLGTLPLFDDLDANQLQSWLRANQGPLAQTLGEQKHQQLLDDAQRLIQHTENWKQSEPAILRRPRRLLTADFAQRFRWQAVDRWRRCDLVDQATAQRLSDSWRFLLTMTFLLGLIPGKVGRFAQRAWANSRFRQRLKRYCKDGAFRRQQRTAFARRKAAVWRSQQRVAAQEDLDSMNARFVIHWFLSKLTPVGLHRWIVDRQQRRNQLSRMFLLCVSRRFQGEYGRFVIRSRIERWRQRSRLTEQQAEHLNDQLSSPAVDEYVRGFGLHVGLKLLLPIMMPLKVGGAAASVASGNPFYFLFMLMLLPLLRTSITLWRMIACRGSVSEFRQALLVGILPVVGSLAYPVQMHARFSHLSLFILRDFAGRVGCWLPIYGGKDSRTELKAIQSVNLIAELMELWIDVTRSADSKTGLANHDLAPQTQTATIRIGRWDKLVSAQLALLQQSEQDRKTSVNQVCRSTGVPSAEEGTLTGLTA